MFPPSVVTGMCDISLAKKEQKTDRAACFCQKAKCRATVDNKTESQQKVSLLSVDRLQLPDLKCDVISSRYFLNSSDVRIKQYDNRQTWLSH